MVVVKLQNGREYVATLDVLKLRAIQRDYGIDLCEPTGVAIASLSYSPVNAFCVLWSCLRDELGRKGMSEQQFMIALGGNVCDDYGEGLQRMALDFFPTSRRSTIEAVIAATNSVLSTELTQSELSDIASSYAESSESSRPAERGES